MSIHLFRFHHANVIGFFFSFALIISNISMDWTGQFDGIRN